MECTMLSEISEYGSFTIMFNALAKVYVMGFSCYVGLVYLASFFPPREILLLFYKDACWEFYV